LLVFLLVVPMAGQLIAEEKIISGKFVVSLAAEGEQKAWKVAAIEQNIYNDLSGYERVIPFFKVAEKEKACKNRNVDCILQLYKSLNVDAIMIGDVDDSDINYKIYDIQNKFLISSGSIDIGNGSSLLKLRMGAFNAFKPFIEKGGILEKRSIAPDNEESHSQKDDLIVKENAVKTTRIRTLIGLAIFVAFPYFYSWFGKPRKNKERSRIVLRWFYPYLLFSLSFIWALYYQETHEINPIISDIISQLGEHKWIITGLGGAAWGLFLIINYKIVMPHLNGIERVKPSNLIPLLKSCTLTLLIKSLMYIFLYMLYFIAVFHLARVFSINQETTVLLVFPLSGLFIFYWIGLLLDVFSLSIDVKLAGENLSYDNVWNTTIRKYFVAYLKRNGVSLRKRFVNNIVFLSGTNQGVVCYGGGHSKPRVTINKDLVKYALGDIDEFNPQETGIFARKIFQPIIRQNSVFQILPDMTGPGSGKKVFSSKQDSKRRSALDTIRGMLKSELPQENKQYSSKIENILQGIVLPKLEGVDDFPSLMSDNFDEMQIVEQLLQENSIGYDPYDEEAEIDDASEKDKDFLFGALLHKAGTLLRHEDIFSTIHLYFRREKGEKKKTYNFPYSKYFATVADTFVVLNFGLNHLLQHLYYQATGNQSPLTTKGNPTGMLKSQDEILTDTKSRVDERLAKSMQTDELERIVWLSHFCQEPLEDNPNFKTRTTLIFRTGLAILLLYYASLSIFNAYSYHPLYIETIEKEKQDIEAIRIEHEKERKQKNE